MKTPVTFGILAAIGIVLVGLFVLAQSLYVVDATEQAIVVRFGVVRTVKAIPGLYAKRPFTDVVIRYDNRVLRIDALPELMLDRDINILEIDAYGRYRITDPVQFRKTLQSEVNAWRVLGQRINAALRVEVAERNRGQIIGGDVELDARGYPVTDVEGDSVVFATESRTILLNDVLSSLRADLAAEPESFGIEMIDVRIKRVDFPGEVQERVFERMRSERNLISSRMRAEGDEQARITQAEAERAVILAQAQRQVNAITAEKNARSIDALIQVLAADRDLLRFKGSLEAYKVARGLARR